MTVGSLSQSNSSAATSALPLYDGKASPPQVGSGIRGNQIRSQPQRTKAGLWGTALVVVLDCDPIKLERDLGKWPLSPRWYCYVQELNKWKSLSFSCRYEVHSSEEDMIKSCYIFTNIATHKVRKNLQEQRKEESSYDHYTSEPLGKGKSLGNNEKMLLLPQIFLVNNMSYN